MKKKSLGALPKLALLTTIVITASYATAEPEASPAGEPRIFKSAHGASMPYRLFIPAKLKPGKRYPLVLCFHGAGDRGTDNQAKGSLAYTTLTSPEVQRKHPAFVIAPQCPRGRQWVNHNWRVGAYDSTKVAVSDEMTLALSIVDSLIEEFSVDKSRIYVTGRSMGGYGAWDAIARRPNFFAAAIPIAGGGDPQCAKYWVNLPIWAIASAGDETCPASGTREVVTALRKIRGKIKYTEDPTMGHAAITDAWKDMPNLADWLFKQRKKSRMNQPRRR